MRRATAAPQGTCTLVQKMEPGMGTFCAEVFATICFDSTVLPTTCSRMARYVLQNCSALAACHNNPRTTM